MKTCYRRKMKFSFPFIPQRDFQAQSSISYWHESMCCVRHTAVWLPSQRLGPMTPWLLHEEFLGGHGGPRGWHKVRCWGPAVQHPSCGDTVPASSGGRQLQVEQRAGCWGCHLLGPWKLRSGSREGTALGCGGWHDWVLQHVRAEQPSCLTQKSGFPRRQAGEAARVALGSLWETCRVFSPEGEALLELHACGLLSWGRCMVARDRRQGCAPHYCKMCLFLRYVAISKEQLSAATGAEPVCLLGLAGNSTCHFCTQLLSHGALCKTKSSCLCRCHRGTYQSHISVVAIPEDLCVSSDVALSGPVLVVRGVWGFIK